MAELVQTPIDLKKVKPGEVPINFVPATAHEMAWCLSDPIWRIGSGQLYKIKIKPPEDSDSDETAVRVVPFKPNRAQRKLVKKMHKRNIILKARQMGFTTFIAILFLDSALFARADNPVTAAIISHTEKMQRKFSTTRLNLRTIICRPFCVPICRLAVTVPTQ